MKFDKSITDSFVLARPSRLLCLIYDLTPYSTNTFVNTYVLVEYGIVFSIYTCTYGSFIRYCNFRTFLLICTFNGLTKSAPRGKSIKVEHASQNACPFWKRLATSSRTRLYPRIRWFFWKTGWVVIKSFQNIWLND